MASRKMTFSLPIGLVTRFLQQVPARDRSRYVADALAEKLAEREHRLFHACEVANGIPDVAAIEQEFDGLSGEILEPWRDAPAR